MKKMNKKTILTLAMMALLLTFAVGSTIAYLVTSSGPVVNTFTPATNGNDITEEFDKEIKKNVAVKNTGNIDAYVRAKIVANWQDEDGNVYPKALVAGTDYTITLGTGWIEKGGYYYWPSKLAANASTGNLIVSCQPIDTATPADYHLVVDILSESIQAEPETVVEGAWNVTVTDGKITK